MLVDRGEGGTHSAFGLSRTQENPFQWASPGNETWNLPEDKMEIPLFIFPVKNGAKASFLFMSPYIGQSKMLGGR